MEALAHRLAKVSGEHPKVVLTVSEGFIAKVESIARVHGYNVGFFLVEHMDEKHFRALHDHYAAEKGCAVEYGVIYDLVGGAPGKTSNLAPACLRPQYMTSSLLPTLRGPYTTVTLRSRMVLPSSSTSALLSKKGVPRPVTYPLSTKMPIPKQPMFTL